MSDERTPRRRLLILLGIVLGWAGLVVARLVDVQIYRADELQRLALRQQFARVETEPIRGAIVDRHGFPLAVSKDVSSLYAIPGLVQDPKATAAKLAKIVGKPAKRLQRALEKNDRNFIWIARKLSDEQTRAVAALELPGLGFRQEPKRFYPGGRLGAHLLGYTGLDNGGLAGIEAQFDSAIRGIPGDEITMRDARGVRFMPEPGGLPAVPGDNLVLTIDRSLQHLVERELLAVVNQYDAKAGIAILLDPNNGDILALAAEPSFDPNEFARSSDAVRRNSAVQEAYEPGSTFKAIAFAGALENRLLGLGEHFDCSRGYVEIAGIRIHDHKRFTSLTPEEILAQSSNVGAMMIGSRVPADAYYRQVRRFGFGQLTGVELPGESPGLLASPRAWSKLTRATLSIGQEIGVTPLQLALAYAAIANGGILLEPRIALRLESPGGGLTRRWEPVAVRRALSAETASTLVAMMETVVREGTARVAAIPGVVVAGKTGTAQKIVDGVYSRDRHVASFVGFAPASRPRLVALVVVDEPKGPLYHGGDVAAPVVRRIMEPALVRLGEGATGRTLTVEHRDLFPSSDAARGAVTEIAQR